MLKFKHHFCSSKEVLGAPALPNMLLLPPLCCWYNAVGTPTNMLPIPLKWHHDHSDLRHTSPTSSTDTTLWTTGNPPKDSRYTIHLHPLPVGRMDIV